MKKIFIAVLMMLCTSTAFAGDSEPLKAILKAKTYDEAKALVQNNLSNLAGVEEKAKAYNKLVELAGETYDHEIGIVQENMVAEQLGQGKSKPYDTLALYDASYELLENALECDKYDQMPNEKGKVKAKFHQANQLRAANARLQLINAGQRAAQNGNNADVLKYWGRYVDTGSAPLFADMPNNQDQYIGQIANYAARFAYQEKDYDRASRYIDIALQDPEQYKDALDLKVYLGQQNLKTSEDTIKFLKEVEDLYAKDNTNNTLFATLGTLYSNLGMKDKSKQFVDEKLAADPANQTAWALKGQNLMSENNYDGAIDAYKKADLNNVVVLTYLAFCLNNKAINTNNASQQKALFTESMGYLEKARDLDPDRQLANWTYPLYQCYYSLYGEGDSRTKAIEKLIR